MLSNTLVSVSFLALTTSLAAAQEKATFTHYGIPDSANCATTVNACGPVTASGFTAAISQKQFGVGPGARAGPGCGECWTLTIETDQTGKAVTQKSINVTVNNLCPIAGNEQWCNVPNQYGGQVHFDLCSDTGAAADFFTSSGSGIGVAQPCGSSSTPPKSSSVAKQSSTVKVSSAVYSSTAKSSTAAVTSQPSSQASLAAVKSSTAETSSGAVAGTSSTQKVPDSGSGASSTTLSSIASSTFQPVDSSSTTYPDTTSTTILPSSTDTTCLSTATGISAGQSSVAAQGGVGWNATTTLAAGAGSATGTGSIGPTGTSSSGAGGSPGVIPPHCRHHKYPHGGRYFAYADKKHAHPVGPPSGYGPDGCPHWGPGHHWHAFDGSHH